MKAHIYTLILFFVFSVCKAQSIDSVQMLKVIDITSYKEMNGIGRMKDDANQIIYAGKKNEVLVVEALMQTKRLITHAKLLGVFQG